jgi:putative endonuclease
MPVNGRYYNSHMPHGSNRRFGRAAEWLALLFLLAKGYRLRHRNWRAGRGELDLVMQQRGETVFVEVKARSSSDFGGAIAAVGVDKQRVLVRTAAAYLSRNGLWGRPCRFDVVTVERRRGVLPWAIRHYRDAFQPDLGRQL